MSFERVYAKIQGIVHKTRQDYYLKTWEKSDWDQEGMLILYQLMQAQPGIEHDPNRLYSYFKVKFRSYIKDRVRRQESQKRKFDRLHYEEISELGHLVAEEGLRSDEKVMLRDMLTRYRDQLPAEDKANYSALISGQRFRGRSKMLKDLQVYLSDFRD